MLVLKITERFRTSNLSKEQKEGVTQRGGEESGQKDEEELGERRTLQQEKEEDKRVMVRDYRDIF